jgi:hypothetical protein
VMVRFGHFSATLALVLALANPALAVWDEEYGKWRNQPFQYQHGYLAGVFEGILQIQFEGDNGTMRDRIRNCIPFASTNALVEAMDQTISIDPSYAKKPIVPVLMETLGRICLRTKE